MIFYRSVACTKYSSLTALHLLRSPTLARGCLLRSLASRSSRASQPASKVVPSAPPGTRHECKGARTPAGPLRHAFAACHVPQARDVPGVRMALLPPRQAERLATGTVPGGYPLACAMRHEVSASEHAYRARQRLATSAWWCGRPRANPANASVSRHGGKKSAGEFERLLSPGPRPV